MLMKPLLLQTDPLLLLLLVVVLKGLIRTLIWRGGLINAEGGRRRFFSAVSLLQSERTDQTPQFHCSC